MRIVTLEEHFSLPEFIKRIPEEVIAERGWPDTQNPPPMMQKAQALLPEIGEERLRSMDEAGITVQVLSVSGAGADLLPGEEGIRLAQDYNNLLAQKIAAYPNRFAAFAHLPMQTPEAAAAELERTVKELGFCGAMINGTTNNLFLDDASFTPILLKAQELDVPIYIHPNFPPKAVRDIYYSSLPNDLNSALAAAGFGWHAETGIHILRMIAAGTFDRFPKLQIIIGHMGEMLPFMMARSENVLSKEIRKSDRSLSEILKQQVHITTSGFFTLPPLMTAIETFGIDRIMFSVDYPFSTNEKGKAFLDSLDLPAADLEKLTHGNADRLLKLKV
ncbi:amidohydrolase family protein [Mucilaginibacter arboris]|uniref:Amidohydrolase family protein n=1 Tax=Mucilaginibacter arboris TaxID=2682090 RepID=A0A7K1T185_9SPHI|nr:amidohydrolase family protein [Mucilaginibacter arboris]MVN23342.1 amidohydrolase family protein [Mucilaginibacter arboris]